VSSSDPRSWLDLAESDAVAALRLLLPPESVRQAAYLAQQAAEKAIKAGWSIAESPTLAKAARGTIFVS
jgi:HEPN domain-containing protein